MIRKAIYTRDNESTLIENGKGWNFHEENTQEHLHTLHPYPAKYIPQIPRKAIQAWTKRGDLVYDPFAGSGTTLLEASLLGRPSIGTDNNSVGVLTTKAKIATYTANDLKRLKKFCADLPQKLFHAKPALKLIPTNPNFHYWFSIPILEQLSALKSFILKEPDPIQALLLSIFSSIIVRVSFQDSDTRYAKVHRDIEKQDVDRLYIAKLNEVIDLLPEVMLSRRAKAQIYLHDARNVPFIRSSTVSLIVTSPPYLNAYDYHKYHRQRLHWIEGDIDLARDLEIGSHDEFTRNNATPRQYFADMDACFCEWSRILRRGGHCLIIIGDAIVSKKSVDVADQFIDLLAKHKIRLENRWIRTLHATKRAFNVKNSRITHEHVLLFKKL